ncbi:MAG TPA: hypothetical protein VLM91_06990 [Candidatus Methylomirabilis sp.]|nr:hypothetical protein [Candidatus Methylomirabilis sp.]
MLCRTLRNLVWARLALVLTIGLTLVGGLATPPPVWSESETASLTLRAPELPLTALLGNPALRLEKQAQTSRLNFHKPGQNSRLSAIIRHPDPHPQVQTARAFRGFPRRLLHPGHVKPRSPDDPSRSPLS